MRKLSAVVAVAILATPAASRAVSLTRGPIAGRPDDGSVAVSWRTDVPAASRVDYSLSGSLFWTTATGDGVTTRHTLRLGGLLPGSVYRYQVYADDIPLGPEGEFRTPRDRSESEFAFAAIGDTNGRTVPAIIASRLVEAGVDFAIHTGDVVYPVGGDDLYDAEFFTPFALFLRRAPIIPTIGSHDARTDRAAPLLANFVLPDSGTSAGSRFYAFRQANALFICLDVETSSFGAGSTQYEWLLRTLRTSDATWKFVYFHEPPYSSDVSNALARIVLCPLFELYGVDIVFSGNSHLYERTIPICDYGQPSCRGVVYITEGGGGAAFSSFHRQKFTAVIAASHGYTIGSISGGRLEMRRFDVDGSVIDSFVLEKGVPSNGRRGRAVGR